MSETETVCVEFTVPKGRTGDFLEWLRLATDATDHMVGLRSIGTTADTMPRSVLMKFAEQMEIKLRKNDHKTGWRELPIEALVRLMFLEGEEFKVAFDHLAVNETRKECVDLANFAMIVWDRLSILPQDKPVK